MFGTGAGVTVLIAAGLGMLVGIVVVAQTIYAATIDHLKEYGTLKAIGAANRYIYRVITQQALPARVVGYGVGMAIALAVSMPASRARPRSCCRGRSSRRWLSSPSRCASSRRSSRSTRPRGSIPRWCSGTEVAWMASRRTRRPRPTDGRHDDARAARCRSRSAAARSAAHGRPVRQRQDDAALDHGRDPQADFRPGYRRRVATSRIRRERPAARPSRGSSASCFRASICFPRCPRIENVAHRARHPGRTGRRRDQRAPGARRGRAGRQGARPCRAICRVARNSASRLLARWSAVRASSWPTSRRLRSTRTQAGA